MKEQVRKHLPILIAIFAIGVLTGAFALMQVKNAVPGISVDAFNTIIMIVPCAIALICSFVSMMLASEIGKQLFIVTTMTSLFIGVVILIVTSVWMFDQSFAAQLLENSPEGSIVVPTINAPVMIVRNIAACFVCSVVGCIGGAWLGSRLHPVYASKQGNQNRKKR